MRATRLSIKMGAINKTDLAPVRSTELVRAGRLVRTRELKGERQIEYNRQEKQQELEKQAGGHNLGYSIMRAENNRN